MSDIVTLNGYKIKDEKAVRSYDTIALMKADTKLKEGYHVKTKGYYEANDGANAEYIIVDDDSLVDDGGSIHVLTNGLRAKLIVNDNVNVKQFGAYGDNTHDDTQAFLNAVAYIDSLLSSNKVYILEVPTGVYKVTDTIHLNYYIRMRVKGFVEINYDNTTGTCISIDDTPLKNIYFENGLYKSPIISGKNGGLRIFGKGRDNDTIGIQLAGDTADTSSTQEPRNGIEYVMIERFGVGLKYGTNNNYWTHFTEVVFTNNYKGLQIGSSTVTSIHNTDENITFDKCIFGGNCYALYELAPTIFKFFKTSFDMNEVLFYTNNAGKMIGFYECWIERNGLKKFINFLPEADKGMFINTSQTSKQLIFNNSYFTYGGEDEGAEVKNYLIRGNFTINGDNNHVEVGINFGGGGKHRLFLTDENCYIHKNGMFSSVIALSRKDSLNLNSEFNNTTNGDLPSSVSGTFGDYTVSRVYRFTGEIEDNDYYGENHMLHFTTPGGGYYEFISKKYSCKYGDIIRPLCIFKVDSDYLSSGSGLTCKVHFYDENDNLIETTTPGNINKQEDVYFMPAASSYKTPQMATSYDIEIDIYSNTSMAQEQSEEFYIYGIYSYKL